MPYEAGPFSTQHWYLQWGGKLPGSEQWSCGLRLAPESGVTPTNDPAMLAAAVTAVQAFHTSADAKVGSVAKLSFVKLNLIGVDGRYVEDVTMETPIADVAGGGASTMPNQVALAISLVTGFSRGPAHRGRFYIPVPAVPVEATTGLIAAATATTIKGAAQTFVDALNAIPNSYVAVMSRKFGSPAVRPVTGVEVGRVLDTQRRRRRSLAEQYA